MLLQKKLSPSLWSDLSACAATPRPSGLPPLIVAAAAAGAAGSGRSVREALPHHRHPPAATIKPTLPTLSGGTALSPRQPSPPPAPRQRRCCLPPHRLRGDRPRATTAPALPLRHRRRRRQSPAQPSPSPSAAAAASAPRTLGRTRRPRRSNPPSPPTRATRTRPWRSRKIFRLGRARAPRTQSRACNDCCGVASRTELRRGVGEQWFRARDGGRRMGGGGWVGGYRRAMCLGTSSSRRRVHPATRPADSGQQTAADRRTIQRESR